MKKLNVTVLLLFVYITFAFGQQTSWMMDDLAHLIENTEDREQVLAAMQQLLDSTQVNLSVTTILENDIYEKGARQQSV